MPPVVFLDCKMVHDAPSPIKSAEHRAYYSPIVLNYDEQIAVALQLFRDLRAAKRKALMPFVTAGDPSKSYLMHKMDGDQCAFDSSCTNGTCGVSMPQASPLLTMT